MGQPAGANTRKYTYKDYLSWPADERWELWAGEPVAMVPAPSTAHQLIVVDRSDSLALSFTTGTVRSLWRPSRSARPFRSSPEVGCFPAGWIR